MGHLSPDVTQFDGRLLIADFGVNRFSFKPATKKEKLLRDSLATFERDKGLRLRIVGFSDCIGPEKDNLKLRRARAKEVFRLLGRSARSRVISVGPAPSSTFVPGTDNGTIEGRARNRSAIIEYWREIEAEKLTPPAPPAPPPSPPIDTRLPESVKKRMEEEAEGPMETERRRREAEKKRWDPVPAPRSKSLKDQVRERLRDEGVPEWAIEQLFKTAAAGGRFAANVVLNGMKIGDAAREFVKERLQEIYSWSF